MTSPIHGALFSLASGQCRNTNEGEKQYLPCHNHHSEENRIRQDAIHITHRRHPNSHCCDKSFARLLAGWTGH